MENRNQYSNFAYIYDRLMYDVDYESWCKYIVDILRKYDIRHKDVLELACGTGSIAVRLAEQGYSVTASDMSEDMLSVASTKALDRGQNVKFLCVDMTDIAIEEKYGIVVCLCDSINYIKEEEKLISMFKWVHLHLKEGGIFIFDINSPYKLRQVIGENTFTYNEEDIAYIWDNYIDGDIVEFYLTFFVKEGSLYRRFDEVHAERIYEAEYINKLLKKAGFECVDIMEAFKFHLPAENSQRINFVVRNGHV